ncbi:hypothetical protein ABWH92_09275 [Ahrensia marina]|uniref:hypothetical protein n=1 Tax=Ahrensia marina TaxID=1514904 RepID=UPI0035CEE38C
MSVLLADAYNQSLLDWIYGVWDQLHADSGHVWHIAIPSKRAVRDIPGSVVGVRDYNTDLARDLCRQYGLNESVLPALVFDNFNENVRQQYLSLNGRSEDELRRLFLHCARHISGKHESLQMVGYENISAAIDEVIGAVRLADTRHVLLKKVPAVFSIISRSVGMTG